MELLDSKPSELVQSVIDISAMSSNDSGSDEQTEQPGYVNANANPFRRTKGHPPRHRKTSPLTVVIGNKRDTFIWSPFNKAHRPQSPPCSPPGLHGDSVMMDGLETGERLFSMVTGSEVASN